MSSQMEEQKFRSLVSQLAGLRPDLARENILQMIMEKKNKVGGGYLTDQGALFLVAADLGVTLNYDQKSSTKIIEVTKDLPSVSVRARILSLSPVKTFTRKNDSRQGLLSRLIIYDDSSVCSVNLWDAKASAFINGNPLKAGNMIKISNAYTRASLDGSIVVNVGEKGSIEKLDQEESESDIPPIERRAVPPELIMEPARFLVVRGRVKGEVRSSVFNRTDGSSGNLVSFALTSQSIEEGDSPAEMRVVIWENPNPVFAGLRDGEVITLLNVRSKFGRGPRSDPSAGDSIELHGDETTCVLEYWEETQHWLKKKSAINVPDSSTTDSRGVQPGKESLPFVARILSIGQKPVAGGSIRLLLVDSQKRMLSTTLSKDSVDDVESVKVDDLVICKPDNSDYSTLRVMCSRKGSIKKATAKRDDIQLSSSLFTRIEKLEENSIVSLEAMSLAESVTREVQTKDGLVRRSELSIGDPSGEIRIFAWRDLSKLLDKIPAGERIWFYAVEAQSHEGRKFLNLKNYSRVERRV